MSLFFSLLSGQRTRGEARALPLPTQRIGFQFERFSFRSYSDRVYGGGEGTALAHPASIKVCAAAALNTAPRFRRKCRGKDGQGQSVSGPVWA